MNVGDEVCIHIKLQDGENFRSVNTGVHNGVAVTMIMKSRNNIVSFDTSSVGVRKRLLPPAPRPH
jgi:hypothetical protein